MKTPINDNVHTRIIPGLKSAYQIVSLPFWAWYWLDDFMQKHRVSYTGIYDTYGQEGDFTQTLRQIAELHHDYAMREVYNLANDNELQENQFTTLLNKKTNTTKAQALNLPKIYKLFGFMSCATSLEAVWERRNYRSSNRI